MDKNNIKLLSNNTKYIIQKIKTRTILPNDNLEQIIKDYIPVKSLSTKDIVIIASKIVSICTPKYRFKMNEIKVTWLAKFVTKFIKKYDHPIDPGFKVPHKVQLAINLAGLPRFILAVIIGGILKFVFKKPGYFYIIAGNNISKIDGFIPEIYPEGLKEYGFIVPNQKEAIRICNDLTEKFNINFVITDSNDFDDHLIGFSDNILKIMNKKNIQELISGNPHGQDTNTPLIIAKHIGNR
ncbi:MAG: hypothetical protein NZZ41_06750 [Candidatus Dojkabacteria bacterium]|nr:hypothetical protein [Candidatus Dojkabacteria bacterium]